MVYVLGPTMGTASKYGTGSLRCWPSQASQVHVTKYRPRNHHRLSQASGPCHKLNQVMGLILSPGWLWIFMAFIFFTPVARLELLPLPLSPWSPGRSIRVNALQHNVAAVITACFKVVFRREAGLLHCYITHLQPEFARISVMVPQFFNLSVFENTNPEAVAITNNMVGFTLFAIFAHDPAAHEKTSLKEGPSSVLPAGCHCTWLVSDNKRQK